MVGWGEGVWVIWFDIICFTRHTTAYDFFSSITRHESFFFQCRIFFSTGILLQEIFSPRNQAALQDNFFWNHLLIPPSKVKGSASYYRLNSTEIQVTVVKITDFPHSQHLDKEQGVRDYSRPKQTRCISQVWQWCNIRENRSFSLVQYQNSRYRELSPYSVITSEGYRVRTQNSWKSLEICPAQVSRPGKSLEKEIKIFFKATILISVIWVNFFSGFGQILFNLARQELVPASFKMITFLITLSVEKEVIFLEKSLEKSLEFCIEAVRTLNYLKAYNSVYSLSLWVICSY